MSRTLTCLTLAILGGLFATAPPVTGQEPANTQVAYLVLYVREDARVTIDDFKTTQTGSVRTFVSPPLTPGRRYVYSVKASWVEQGQPRERTEAAHVRAGVETKLDLRPGATGQQTTPIEGERTPDVIFVPTPQAVVDRMLELAKVKKGDVVYDLGCGDGRIVVTAAKKYGCKAFGFDIDPDRVRESLENVKKNNVENLVTIKKADIFTLDLKDASVVTLYLLPTLNVKLMPQLAKLKPGSRIVSHDFDMKGAKPAKIESVTARDDRGFERNHPIYLWIVPWEKE
jgi:uncharacterized protein (TIGR03000 family)